MWRSSVPVSRFLAACSVVASVTIATADDASSPAVIRESTQSQNSVQPPEIANNDSNDSLEDVLKRWKQARSQVNRIDAHFSYIRYNTVPSKVRRYGEGQCAFDSSGRGILRLVPAKLSSDQRAELPTTEAKDKSGFAIGPPIDALQWRWTGTHAYVLDGDSDEMEILEIPPEERLGEFHPTRPAPPSLPEIGRVRRSKAPSAIGKSKPEEHLTASGTKEFTFWDRLGLVYFNLSETECARPFIIGTPIEVLQQHYDITLVPNSGPAVRLRFQSKEPRSSYPNAELIMSRESWMPKALKLIGPGEMGHSVYVFHKVLFNSTNGEPLGYFKRPAPKRHRPGSFLST